MKKRIIFTVILLMSIFGGCKNERIIPRAYFINAESGDDANAGTSPDKAWKTLTMINKIHLKAGVRVLLKGGQIYYRYY